MYFELCAKQALLYKILAYIMLVFLLCKFSTPDYTFTVDGGQKKGYIGRS